MVSYIIVLLVVGLIAGAVARLLVPGRVHLAPDPVPPARAGQVPHGRHHRLDPRRHPRADPDAHDRRRARPPAPLATAQARAATAGPVTSRPSAGDPSAGDPSAGGTELSWLANCVWYSSVYSPSAASSSVCVPRSVTLPPSMTRIWSAWMIVESRCAITSEVRPASAVFSARCTAASDSESRCAVASSSTTTDGALSSSLASAIRCFSPSDSR